MAIVAQVSIEGRKELARLMARLDPKRDGVQWQRDSLEEIAFEVQSVATKQKIRRGGRTRKGSSAPLLGVLTSRTGDLRGSIGVDRAPLPGAIEVGSALKYAAVHELGGTFTIPQHTRDLAEAGRSGGRRVALVKAHKATFPRRPYLVPALNDVEPKMAGIFVKHINKVLGSRV